MISVNETHLKGEQKLKLDGYQWVGHNRAKQHSRARKAFGGVGLFIRHSIFESHKVTIEFNECDDILGVLFVNKSTDYSFIVYSMYLPPENSTVFNDAPLFFNRLLLEVYKHSKLDAIFFVGDINARLGNLKDHIDLDNIPERVVLDNTDNNHGKALREFLIDSKCCILNGRITPQYDNFTFVSSRGTSVVDYMITAHDCIKNVVECKVDLCSDIINELGMERMISDACRAPDHSLLTITVKTSPYAQLESRMLGAKNYSNNSSNCTRFKVRNLPGDFMNSEHFTFVINELIDRINVSRESQACVDEMYDKFVKT